MIHGRSTCAAVGIRSAAKIAGPAARLDTNNLMMHRVTAGAADAHARQHLAIVVDEIARAGFQKRHIVFRQVAGAIALVRVRRVLPLAAPDAYRARGKRGHERPSTRARESAGVIEVQMRGHDDVDVVG